MFTKIFKFLICCSFAVFFTSCAQDSDFISAEIGQKLLGNVNGDLFRKKHEISFPCMASTAKKVNYYEVTNFMKVVDFSPMEISSNIYEKYLVTYEIDVLGYFSNTLLNVSEAFDEYLLCDRYIGTNDLEDVDIPYGKVYFLAELLMDEQFEPTSMSTVYYSNDMSKIINYQDENYYEY